MRISDWSSDVCSSDLVGLEGAGNGAGARSAEPRGARYSRLCRARRHGQGYLHPRALARRGALSGEDGTEPRRRVLLALIGASRRYEEGGPERPPFLRTAENTSELQAIMRIQYAIIRLKK